MRAARGMSGTTEEENQRRPIGDNVGLNTIRDQMKERHCAQQSKEIKRVCELHSMWMNVMQNRIK